MLRALQVCSLVVVPMKVEGTTIGSIVLGVWKPHHARLYGLSLTGAVQW